MMDSTAAAARSGGWKRRRRGGGSGRGGYMGNEFTVMLEISRGAFVVLPRREGPTLICV